MNQTKPLLLSNPRKVCGEYRKKAENTKIGHAVDRKTAATCRGNIKGATTKNHHESHHTKGNTKTQRRKQNGKGGK